MHVCMYGIEVTQAVAVETAGFEAGDSAPSGCIEQVAHASVRICVVVVVVVVCMLCVCVYVCVYEWARARG